MKNKRGFTLIELLVAVAIIGILAAIAIPQFAQYRAQAFCARVVSDAKNAFVAMEAYYAANLVYDTLDDTNFTPTEGVNVQIVSTAPLSISATDGSGHCIGTYTLDESSGKGQWN